LVKLKAIEVCFHNQYTNCNDELFEQHSVKIYKDHEIIKMTQEDLELDLNIEGIRDHVEQGENELDN